MKYKLLVILTSREHVTEFAIKIEHVSTSEHCFGISNFRLVNINWKLFRVRSSFGKLSCYFFLIADWTASVHDSPCRKRSTFGLFLYHHRVLWYYDAAPILQAIPSLLKHSWETIWYIKEFESTIVSSLQRYFILKWNKTNVSNNNEKMEMKIFLMVLKSHSVMSPALLMFYSKNIRSLSSVLSL